MVDIFTDRASAVLTKVMDGTAIRQRALANNIANTETPGYQRQDVDFATRLQDITSGMGDGVEAINSIDSLPIEIQPDTLSPQKVDGNSVQIEREMVELAKNTLQYETSAQLLQMKYRSLSDAIRGTGR